jgi:hypothetical protein
MSDNQNQNNDEKKPLEQSDNIHQKATEMMLKGIFLKHGITKDKLNPLSDEQKEQLLSLAEEFKEQAEAFLKTEKKKPKKTKGKGLKKKP